MKAHRSNRSEPVAWEFLNLFEFGFEFNRFPPVTGQTGPVNRNRSPAVTGNRLGNKTQVASRVPILERVRPSSARCRPPGAQHHQWLQ